MESIFAANQFQIAPTLIPEANMYIIKNDSMALVDHMSEGSPSSKHDL